MARPTRHTDVLEHALDPFFTTKGPSKGTGLGLSQVYALAKQSDGDVKIESIVGQGTHVHLILPVVAAGSGMVESVEPAEVVDEFGTGTGKRILVLDDDAGVRSVVVENLRSRGYIVFEASTGEDALSALSNIVPDLLLLDFLMPGMNGAEVARRAKDIRPEQKILIISGHLDNVLLDAVVADIPILKKPFDGATLARRVTEVLRSSGTAQARRTSVR